MTCLCLSETGYKLQAQRTIFETSILISFLSLPFIGSYNSPAQCTTWASVWLSIGCWDVW